MNPIHQALRRGTALAHERVDAAFGAFDLTDRHSYACFLAAHAEVVLPLEAALDAAGAERIVPDWPERRRGPALREDLAALRGALDAAIVGRPQAPWPDLAATAGALYVVEGSRLGGKFLARLLPREFPHAYLNSPQPAERWRNLMDRLQTMLYEPAALQSALSAAHEAFAAFERSAATWTKGIAWQVRSSSRSI